MTAAGYLCSPDVVQVLQGESFLFNNEAQDLLQLLHILRLMKTVSQDNGQNVVLLNPFLTHTQIISIIEPQSTHLKFWVIRCLIGSYSHALCSQPLLLLWVAMTMGVIRHAGDHFVHLI